jgi:hypothetical protein
MSAARLRIGYRITALASVGAALFEGPQFVPGAAGVLLLGCRTTLIPQLVMAPILLAAHAALTRRPTITKIAAVSVLFGIPTIGFVLAYLG